VRGYLNPVSSTETGELVVPHPRRDEDEFSFRGRIGGRREDQLPLDIMLVCN
jgi:hypothetical protein